LNGWTVCRFHGVRGGGAERQDEWRLPARLQDEGNDRSLEAYKITALMSAYGGKADIEWKRFHVRPKRKSGTSFCCDALRSSML